LQGPSGQSVNNWKLLSGHGAGVTRNQTVCVANQKGGVAKTTTALNLGAALALRGHSVLLIDVDPQSNATTGLGIDHREVEQSTYDLVIGEAELEEVVVETAIPNLHLAPGSLDLAGAEIELVGATARERRLADSLEASPAIYDFVFLDCPPSLGLLTVNALAAARDLIVPVQCEYYALEGLGQLLETAERIRRSVNPELRISGFLLTMYDARTKLASQVAAEVRSHFGNHVFQTVIPRSVRLSEAPSFGEPVVTLDASARGAVAYRLLAEEVEARYEVPAQPAPPPPPPPIDGGETRPELRGPGPGGRGYGVTTAQPPALEEAWPVPGPWSEAPLRREA
jgi:chromosome partitioning protein